MPATLKNLTVATRLEKVSFHCSKKGNAKKCSIYHTIAFISYTSKVMLKIVQARLQQCVNWELPDIQAGFRKGSGIRDQIANIFWIIEKAREFQKMIYFCFIDYTKAFYCVDHKKLGNSSRGGNTRPPYLPREKPVCRLRINKQWTDIRATDIITRHETEDWFQIEKGVHQSCILSHCLFNFYAAYIMQNGRLDEEQSRIKIGKRNISNLRYVDDTMLMAKSKEELKSLLMKVKQESEKTGLKLNI